GFVKALIVGSGCREPALAWKLASSPALAALHAAPGNLGIASLGQCHPVRAEDGEGLLSLCREARIDLVVVGPEAPLVVGLADTLRRNGGAGVRATRSAARVWVCAPRGGRRLGSRARRASRRRSSRQPACRPPDASRRPSRRAS